ncbi:MAG: DUF2064 domain-containing protein [Flavobacteriia bacterium]|nr:DUF2064 domain-containing protein [Flavobacteriia bacterium]OIP47554.1 MAG: hypothetical protein AUK46_04655 [Flavobacteriaceae bacterium CG2_30_31_66]PIV97989.1 MAG: hypothetical protein COW43_00125 [Flavobacteriaceae bacterium CG17_big_fil_post_rev_8_21_14_2_50_31_13]PIX12325.1 MAG: hypothetical protein COZ74_11645 [Flavobacteriaceae bacterium CG_4_8_14_3_um_filter_31_8]PIY15818.1 MAG: hypothetical protein COZ16_02565 [Flavobacteriaceae bacterium CG_4_10_14_3_um_filter_31_253]PIZ09809.1 M
MILSKDYSTSTAILLFAQSEKVESVSKPIVCQKKQNSLLWKKMNEKVLQTIQKTYIPYFISDENTQIGNTFGEKITHSIQTIFNKGFEKVIVIGNDCLELQAKHLLDTSHKLQKNDAVLGADFNGGAYLIGVSKSSFNANEFATIAWQTRFVFDELKQLFGEIKTAFTPSLNDCNSAFDFKKAVHKLSFSDSFKNVILSLLQNKTVVPDYETSFLSYEFDFLDFNKGSPFSF